MEHRLVCAAVLFGALLGGAAVAAAQEPQTGKVVDAADGTPVQGAVIAFRKPDGGQELSWHDGRLWGDETGEAGEFTIPSHAAGGECIAVHPRIGCSAWTTVPKGGALTLKLVRGNVVEGVVRAGKEGPGIPGLTISFAPAGESWFHNGPQVVSGEGGRFRLAGIPPGLKLQATVAPSPRIRGLVEASQPFAFEATGGQVTRDVLVDERPGVRMTFGLQFGQGVAAPARILVGHVTLTREPAADGGGGMTSSSAGGDGEFESVTSNVVNGVLETRTEIRRWHRLDGEVPKVELYFPAGDNEVTFQAPGWTGAFPKRVVKGKGDPESHTVAMEKQARVVLQLVDLQGKPLKVAGVSVSINHTTSSGGSTSSVGSGGIPTDAEGRADLTGKLVAPGDPPAGTKVTIAVRCSGQGLSFPKGAGPSWAPAELRALLKSDTEEGIVWLEVAAAPPAEVVVRLVDGTGAAVANEQLSTRLSGTSARGVTDGDGRVRLRVPPGTHQNVKFWFRQGIEMDPITLTAPSEAEIVVKVRRFILQRVTVEIAGVPPDRQTNPGVAAVKAFDAAGAEIPGAAANVAAFGKQWGIFIRAPGAARKLEVTFREQTLTIDVPDGKPVNPPNWSVK